MKFDPTKHTILAGYLQEVKAVLLQSNISSTEAESIAEDLAVQIDTMLESVEGDVTETDQIEVMRQLDSPESFVKLGLSHPNRDPGGSSANWIFQHPIATAVIGLTAAIAGLASWMISLRNQIITADELVDSSYAQVETVLQRRFDLIPNLVSTVKGFAEQEREILTEVTRLRSQWAESGSRDQKVQTANQLEGALSKLLLVSENYPDLRSSEQFSQLQFQLEGTENRISIERNRYNSAVRHHNTLVRKFPASLLNFEPKEAYFEAIDGAETTPAVKF